MASAYDATIHALDDTWTSLAEVLDSLSAEDWRRPTGCPGWSVQDQVSHIVGVERMLNGEPEPRHELPEGLPHVRDAFGRRVERPVDYRRAWEPARVRAEYGEVVAARLAVLRAATEDELAALVDSPFGRIPMGSFLGIRAFDCYAHEQDVRRATDRRGHVDGPAARVVWKGAAGVLARSLTERVPALGEQVVVLAPQPGAAVAMGGGRVLSEVVGAPSVRLAGPFDEFIALLCGRSDARPERVTALGDPVLAQALLGALSVTP